MPGEEDPEGRTIALANTSACLGRVAAEMLTGGAQIPEALAEQNPAAAASFGVERSDGSIELPLWVPVAARDFVRGATASARDAQKVHEEVAKVITTPSATPITTRGAPAATPASSADPDATFDAGASVCTGSDHSGN